MVSYRSFVRNGSRQRAFFLTEVVFWLGLGKLKEGAVNRLAEFGPKELKTGTKVY
jgi:hypothetical protein